MTDIAFIGLGNMGAPMCANLVAAGHSVRAFDVDSEAVTRAADRGAAAANSIADCVDGASIVITMLPSGEHVRGVLCGAEGGFARGAADTLFVDCSTIAVDEARTLAETAGQHGLPMLDAPVSGGVAGAESGALTFMIGGHADHVERARPLFETMGKNVFHAGGAGNGQAAKVANNLLLGISMIGTCEAFLLAERLGLDVQTFFDITSKASGQCWSVTSYCPVPGPVPGSPANRDYRPGFAVDMMWKDLRLAMAAAGQVGAPVTLGAMAERVYAALHDCGAGGQDFSVVRQRLDAGPIVGPDAADPGE